MLSSFHLCGLFVLLISYFFNLTKTLIVAYIKSQFDTKFWTYANSCQIVEPREPKPNFKPMQTHTKNLLTYTKILLTQANPRDPRDPRMHAPTQSTKPRNCRNLAYSGSGEIVRNRSFFKVLFKILQLWMNFFGNMMEIFTVLFKWHERKH